MHAAMEVVSLELEEVDGKVQDSLRHMDTGMRMGEVKPALTPGEGNGYVCLSWLVHLGHEHQHSYFQVFM